MQQKHSGDMENGEGYQISADIQHITRVNYLRLKVNFKMLLSGQSKGGETMYVSKLDDNIHSFSKLQPNRVLMYLYGLAT